MNHRFENASLCIRKTERICSNLRTAHIQNRYMWKQLNPNRKKKTIRTSLNFGVEFKHTNNYIVLYMWSLYPFRFVRSFIHLLAFIYLLETKFILAIVFPSDIWNAQFGMCICTKYSQTTENWTIHTNQNRKKIKRASRLPGMCSLKFRLDVLKSSTNVRTAYILLILRLRIDFVIYLHRKLNVVSLSIHSII